MAPFTYRPAAPAEPLPDVLAIADVADWVKGDADDRQLSVLISAAMRWAEGYCEQPLFSREFITRRSAFESGDFTTLNVTEITSVKYRVFGTADFVDTAPAEYELINNRVVFAAPVFALEHIDAVEIRFKAGFTTVPEDIKLAMLLCIGDWYDNRADGKRTAPSAAENLLTPYRLLFV